MVANGLTVNVIKRHVRICTNVYFFKILERAVAFPILKCYRVS